MAGGREWLLTIISASLLCAVADSLMPDGSVKQVGKLVRGLVLLCAVLMPAAHFDLADGQQWMEDYLATLEQQEEELREQYGMGLKAVIEEECAAYIVDKAADLGVICTAQVYCRLEDGLYLPDETQVTGKFTDVAQSQLTQLIWEDLGVPAVRQTFYDGEGPP